jgi:hypothetical protein
LGKRNDVIGNLLKICRIKDQVFTLMQYDGETFVIIEINILHQMGLFRRCKWQDDDEPWVRLLMSWVVGLLLYPAAIHLHRPLL